MPTSVNTKCDVEKTEHHIKSSTKKTQSNGWPLKSWVFCRVEWANNSSAKRLIHTK